MFPWSGYSLAPGIDGKLNGGSCESSKLIAVTDIVRVMESPTRISSGNLLHFSVNCMSFAGSQISVLISIGGGNTSILCCSDICLSVRPCPGRLNTERLATASVAVNTSSGIIKLPVFCGNIAYCNSWTRYGVFCIFRW